MGMRRSVRILAAGAVTCMALAGCGDGTSGGNSASEGRRGGILILAGQGDVDHLDTASGYYTATYTLERAFTRQLVTYPADQDFDRANEIVADLATEVPTEDNGGISADGMTYTFTIRDGTRWNTSPPRQVTAEDFVRGFERLCNPASPVRNPACAAPPFPRGPARAAPTPAFPTAS